MLFIHQLFNFCNKLENQRNFTIICHISWKKWHYKVFCSTRHFLVVLWQKMDSILHNGWTEFKILKKQNSIFYLCCSHCLVVSQWNHPLQLLESWQKHHNTKLLTENWQKYIKNSTYIVGQLKRPILFHDNI